MNLNTLVCAYCLFLALVLSGGCGNKTSDLSRSDAGSSVEDFQPARLRVEDSQINLGDFNFGNDFHEANFWIENVGASQLEVTELRTSCGSVSASVSPAIIPPGAKANVRLRLAGDRLGEQATQIIISSNCFVTPERPVTLQWRVYNEMTPFPSVSNGNLIRAGEEQSIPIAIRIRRGLDVGNLLVTLEDESNDDLEISIARVSEYVYDLKCRAGKYVSEDVHVGNVVFTSSALGTVRVPFSFIVEPEVVATPANLWLDKKGDFYQGEIVIRSKSMRLPETITIFSEGNPTDLVGHTMLVSKSDLKVVKVAFKNMESLPQAVIVDVNGIPLKVRIHY